MLVAKPPGQDWSVHPAPVGSEDCAALLRDYYVEVSDRYFELHLGRRSTRTEIEQGLRAFISDDLTPPTGVFLLARYGDEPAGCAGLRVLASDVVELTRMFVRPERRATGGGSRLLAAIDEASRDLGAKRIVLDTRLDLVEARAIYVKHGYSQIPAYTDHAYAEVWYGKDVAY